MRLLLPLAIFLTACSPLATPAPYVPAVARPEQIADAGATLAVAAAGATYAAQQTQVAYTATVQAGAVVGTALAAQAFATRAAIDSQSTQSALTVTAQAVQAAQATGTFRAQVATQTATAAIPAMTETRAAQVAQAQRGGQEWVIVWGLIAAAILCACYAGVRHADAQGAEKKARAAAELREAQARAYSLEMAAMKNATQIQTIGRMVLVIVSGEITAARRLPEETEMRLIEQPPNVPGGNVSMVQFVRDAQRAAGVQVATFIPSNDRMGWASTSAWQAHVDVLKALKIAYTDGTGRPAAGEYRTKLADGWSLARLLSELENGQLIIQGENHNVA